MSHETSVSSMSGTSASRWLSVFEDPSQVVVYTQYQTLLTSMACILFYDYFLTLKNEFAFVWRSRCSLGTIFFLIIRYGFLIDISLVLLYTLRITQESGPTLTAHSCKLLYDMATAIQVVSFAAVSAFVALRITALWSHNWPLGVFLFLVGLFNPSTLIPMIGLKFDMLPAPWPMFPCVQTVTHYSDIPFIDLINYDFPIASSAVSIAYEFLCLILTIVKTVGAYRVQRQFGMQTTLSGLLLRDGSLYFAVLTALGIFNVVAASIPETPLPVDISVVLGRVFVPILTTRFIINIQQTGRPPLSQGTLASFRATRVDNAVSTLDFA